MQSVRILSFLGQVHRFGLGLKEKVCDLTEVVVVVVCVCVCVFELIPSLSNLSHSVPPKTYDTPSRPMWVGG